MRELGYIEGRDLNIDTRWMTGVALEEAAKLTEELVRLKVDVLVAQGFAVPGVKSAAASLPVVFAYSGDPVAAKFVASLAHPGGNLTGLSLLAVSLAGKRVELLKEVAPRISRLAAITNPLHPGEDDEFREAKAVANRMGIMIRHFPVRTNAELDEALDTMVQDQVDGIIALSNLLVMLQRSSIADFAVKHRIPTISGWEDFALDGNLMSYGPDLHYAFRQLATYVDKLLKGAKPADLPVQQPTRFQLVVNLRTARALGLTIPPALLLRADRVVEQ
jgi:putative ABC transport system substrate-binding protein